MKYVMKQVLRCAEKQKEYDEKDFDSIIRYARTIEGKTFLRILQEGNLTKDEIEWVKTKESDKGLLGKIVEATFFGYELNSRQEADFNHVETELKTTPADLKKEENGGQMRYCSGETISITQIDFNHPVTDSFDTSHLLSKLKSLIVIFYFRNKKLASKLDYEIFYASAFRPSDKDLIIIKDDYQKMIEKITSGNADKLSRADGMYLGNAPKAQNKKNMVKPYYGGAEVVKRSFTLKKDYVNIILWGFYKKKHVTKEQIVTDLEELQKSSLIEIIYNKINYYQGLSVEAVVDSFPSDVKERFEKYKEFEVKPKEYYSLVAAGMLGLKKYNASEEFSKTGIVAKTIMFDEKRKNKEQFRLEDAHLMKIYESPQNIVETDEDEEGNEYQIVRPGWEETDLYNHLLSMRYLLIVFQKDKNGTVYFRGCRLWSMPDEDLQLALKDWLDIKGVLESGVRFTIKEDGKTYNNFPGIKDSRCIHLRPHAGKGYYVDQDGRAWGNGKLADTEVLPDGGRMTRQSFWLKNTYIKQFVMDLLK